MRNGLSLSLERDLLSWSIYIKLNCIITLSSLLITFSSVSEVSNYRDLPTHWHLKRGNSNGLISSSFASIYLQNFVAYPLFLPLSPALKFICLCITTPACVGCDANTVQCSFLHCRQKMCSWQINWSDLCERTANLWIITASKGFMEVCLFSLFQDFSTCAVKQILVRLVCNSTS